jgi:hypothetical protein
MKLEELVYQIRLDPNVAREQIGEKQLRKSGLFMENSDGG